MYRCGGREYPLKTFANCRVCRSKERFEVERLILEGKTYRTIVESISPDAELTIRNVGEHYRNEHMPSWATTMRSIIEARGEAVGKQVDEGIENLVDGITMAETVVQRTFVRIASGELDPEIKDGLRAFKMLSDLGVYDPGGGGLNQQMYTEAFSAYHSEVADLLSSEQFAALSQALNANPVLRALSQRYHEVVEGELVEDGGVDR